MSCLHRKDLYREAARTRVAFLCQRVASTLLTYTPRGYIMQL